MRRRRIAALALALCWVGIAAVAAGSDPAVEVQWRQKVHPGVFETTVGGEPLDFLVVLDEQAPAAAIGRRAVAERRGAAVVAALRETAARTQAPLIERVEAHGGAYRAFWIVNAVHVRGDVALLEALAARPDVRRVDANPRVRMNVPRVEPPGAAKRGAGVQWNIARIGADVVWGMGFDGQGVVVAAHDTGFDWSHSALAPQYRGWDDGSETVDHAYNWHDAVHTGGGACGPDSPEPCADGGHGTHVMGTIAGDDGGLNRIGVAPGARWIGCRNMDGGDGTPATYTECFEWFIAPTDAAGQNPDPSKAPHVINNSWICPASEGCEPDTLKLVVENVRAAGIVVVGGAGNSGSSCSSVTAPPAIYEATVSVGATDSGDEIAGFSSRGPVTVDGSGRMKPDVAAPGVAVNSSTPSGGYAAWSGTSMASPHVAGVVALLLSARPDLKGRVDEIQYILEQTATPYTTTGVCGDDVPGESIPNNAYGWGRVDALAAISGDPDGDAVGNLTDCRPADASLWAVPSPVVDLTLSHDGVTWLSWSDATAPGGESVSYHLLRSTTPDDFATSTCLTHLVDNTAGDDQIPVGLFHYLVQVENVCGATTGTMSGGVARTPTTCP